MIRLRIGIIKPPGSIRHGVSYLVKPIGKGPLGRHRRRWEDNITIGLKEMGINMRDWIDSAQNKN